MNPIELHEISFGWPDESGRVGGELLFDGVTLAIPEGMTFFVGPNGIGKSSLMLLAGGRLPLVSGEVRVTGVDMARFVSGGIDPEEEEHRNRLVSFVYQNMEFEVSDTVGNVLEIVCAAGGDERGTGDDMGAVVDGCELTESLNKSMDGLSKGEMQRVVIAMSVLYRSPVVMMDEPLFAVESDVSHRVMAFLKRYLSTHGMSACLSVHDVVLARDFADTVVLLEQSGAIEVGDPQTLLSRERLERAFRAPYATLYERQRLYRELLVQGV